MKFAIVLVFLAIFVNLIECKCSNSFEDVTVAALPLDGPRFNVTLKDCIKSTAFRGSFIKSVYAQYQVILELNKDSVKNMDYLESITLESSSILKVEPGAFNGVPRLQQISLVKSAIKEIPEGLFNNLPSLEVIRLTHNRIQNISANAFANIGKLKKVYASNNKLEYWSGAWFANSPNVEKIDFKFNLISRLNGDAFRNLPNLDVINFDYNNIEAIEAGALQGLRRLKYLGLRHNRLSNLDYDIFPARQIFIESLYIDANKLNFLSNKTLERVVVKSITLDGNPWKCPCLENIGSWLRGTNGRVRASKYCKNLNVMQCIPYHRCEEEVDAKITISFVNEFRTNLIQIGKSLQLNKNYCVRLD